MGFWVWLLWKETEPGSSCRKLLSDAIHGTRGWQPRVGIPPSFPRGTGGCPTSGRTYVQPAFSGGWPVLGFAKQIPGMILFLYFLTTFLHHSFQRWEQRTGSSRGMLWGQGRRSSLAYRDTKVTSPYGGKMETLPWKQMWLFVNFFWHEYNY